MTMSQFFRPTDEFRAVQESDAPFRPTSQGYVKASGVCPQCNTDNVDWGDLEPEGDEVYRYGECNVCGLQWTEIYTLTGVHKDKCKSQVLLFEFNNNKAAISLGSDGLFLHEQGKKPVDLLDTVCQMKRMKPLVDAIQKRDYPTDQGFINYNQAALEAMHVALKKYEERSTGQ